MMGVDRSPQGQPITGHMMVLGDRYYAHDGESIDNGSVVKWTGLYAGSLNDFEIVETDTLGEQCLGVNIKFKPATGVRDFVSYLNRRCSICVHGPVKVRNGGTGAIWPSDSVTPAGPATDANGVTWYGLITRRTVDTQMMLGYALDYFGPFDANNDVHDIFVTQEMIR